MRRFFMLFKAFLFCTLLCGGLIPSNAYAWSSITILSTNSSPAISEFVQQFKASIHNVNGDIEIHQTSNENGLVISIPKDTLVVAIGTQALNYASNLDEHTPVLGLLVPKLAYEKILRESGRKPKDFSAIYIDQPFSRQISLIKKIIPNTKEISVLLGPTSQFSSNDIQHAAQNLGMSVSTQLVERKEDIQTALNDSLSQKSPILAVPDPLIYSRETTQTILLSSYRHRVPLIGFSQTYVSSGAVAATFTTPKQFGIEAAEIIHSLLNKKITELPSATFPKLFSIDINYRVARTLGLLIGDEKSLMAQMLKDDE